MNETKLSTRRTPRRGVPAYTKNPFWFPHEIVIGKKFIRVSGGKYINYSGQTISQSGIHIIEEKDKDEFVKLYTKNMKLFFDLKPSTQKVLMAVLNSVQKSPGSDKIYLNWFNVEDYSKENEINISRASFHNAMKELLQKKFIAESEDPNMYWINPHLFFNGDRMIFIREYRKNNQKELKE